MVVHPIWNDHPAVEQGLRSVKDIIKNELGVTHPQVKEKILSYLDASGKYIRAGLTLMVGQAVDGEVKETKLYFAASIEVLHLATLIHDDVIDEADTRRGIIAMHKTHSNRIAIYAGDYLLAYSSRLLKKGIDLLGAHEDEKNLFNDRIIERILAGELDQLMNQHRPDMRMKDYLKQIKGKTAFLFAFACQLGAWTVPASRRQMRSAFNAGQAIGMAFQLSDDLLDYQVSEDLLGKPQLQDVQNGIYTAPLLFAMDENKEIRKLLACHEEQDWKAEELVQLEKWIANSSGYEETERLIGAYLEKSQTFLGKLQSHQPLLLDAFLEKVMERKF